MAILTVGGGGTGDALEVHGGGDVRLWWGKRNPRLRGSSLAALIKAERLRLALGLHLATAAAGCERGGDASVERRRGKGRCQVGPAEKRKLTASLWVGLRGKIEEMGRGED